MFMYIHVHVHVPPSEKGSIFCHSVRETAESMRSEMSGGQSLALDHAYHTHPPTGWRVEGECDGSQTYSGNSPG